MLARRMRVLLPNVTEIILFGLFAEFWRREFGVVLLLCGIRGNIRHMLWGGKYEYNINLETKSQFILILYHPITYA